MTTSFNPNDGPIVVEGELEGPTGSTVLSLILDTGATESLLNEAVLRHVGYDLTQAPHHVQVTTSSGVEQYAFLPILRIKALGHEKTNHFVLAHTLPHTLGVDGLLGLNFIRGQALTIDFRTGTVTLR